MSALLSRAVVGARRVQRREARLQQPPMSQQELGALRALRAEAAAAGTKLENAGLGPISPSLQLHVMRVDGFACRSCGSKDAVSVRNTKMLEARLRPTNVNGLEHHATLCARCMLEARNRAAKAL